MESWCIRSTKWCCRPKTDRPACFAIVGPWHEELMRQMDATSNPRKSWTNLSLIRGRGGAPSPQTQDVETADTESGLPKRCSRAYPSESHSAPELASKLATHWSHKVARTDNSSWTGWAPKNGRVAALSSQTARPAPIVHRGRAIP